MNSNAFYYEYQRMFCLSFLTEINNKCNVFHCWRNKKKSVSITDFQQKYSPEIKETNNDGLEEALRRKVLPVDITEMKSLQIPEKKIYKDPFGRGIGPRE